MLLYNIIHYDNIISDSKGKATFVMTPRGRGKTIEVCQKAFMNVYGITEKRVRLQREKLIARLRDRSPPPLVSPVHLMVSIHINSFLYSHNIGIYSHILYSFLIYHKGSCVLHRPPTLK